MDPITQALALANTVAQIILLTMQHMPAEEWAKSSDLRMKQLDGVIKLVEFFTPKEKTP